MKKLLAFSLVSSSIFLSANSVKADWDYWAFEKTQESYSTFVPEENTHYSGNPNIYKLYTVNSADGSATLRKTFCSNTVNCNRFLNYPRIIDTIDIAYPENHVNKDSFIIRENEEVDGSWTTVYKKYSLSGNSLTSETVSSSNDYWFDSYQYTQLRGAAQIDSDGNYYSDIGGQMWIKQTSDGTISFGKSGSDTAIYSLSENGVSQGGSNLISRTSDGITSIGANSLKLQESGGLQKMWATEASGKSIPIDITNGTKLLINGRDVEQSINNIGALSAALTGLPTVPTDTTLACGLGTGTHGGDFAFSGGCASKVNEKLSINYAASMTMPGQDYAGDFEDTFSARAGFVWKLGKSNQPTQISMRAKEEMEDKMNSLEEKNEKILSKNQNLENTVSTLLARLERLEKVALSEAKSKDLATIKLP